MRHSIPIYDDVVDSVRLFIILVVALLFTIAIFIYNICALINSLYDNGMAAVIKTYRTYL